MAKDYVPILVENFDILGHKVKAITEIFSDEYLDSDRFESRCLRCCFCNKDKVSICNFINCNWYSTDKQTHFELVNEQK